jgi:hypothetical protein
MPSLGSTKPPPARPAPKENLVIHFLPQDFHIALSSKNLIWRVFQDRLGVVKGFRLKKMGRSLAEMT